MPAQRLSSVAPNAVVQSSPTPFEPSLVLKAATIISSASILEAQLGTLLVEILQTSAEPAAAMLRALTSAAASRAAILAAAQTVLPADRFEIFDAITRMISKATKARNLIAHSPWEYSPDLPDAILFVEQSAYMKLNLELARREKDGWIDKTEVRFDDSLIWVYRNVDFDEAIEALNRALTLLVQFRIERRLGELPDIDPQYHRLSSQPEIAEFLAHRERGRKMNPRKP